MHPRVNSTYQTLAEKYKMKGPFLEIGVGNREAAILSGEYFIGKPDRFATNLAEKDLLEEQDTAKIQFVRCNSNDMRDVFTDGQFGTVLSNAVIEHDKYFWRSLDEMKRILAPGGILAVGAPAYVRREGSDTGIVNEQLSNATVTMDVHSVPDYWRFSPMAFREVICEGLEFLEMCVVGRVPVLMAIARKPLTGLLPPVPQMDRLTIYAEDQASNFVRRGFMPPESRVSGGPGGPGGGKSGAKGAAAGGAKSKLAPGERKVKLQEREARLQSRLQALLDQGSGEASELVTRLKGKLAELRQGNKKS